MGPDSMLLTIGVGPALVLVALRIAADEIAVVSPQLVGRFLDLSNLGV
jgi:hypothetical protein